MYSGARNVEVPSMAAVIIDFGLYKKNNIRKNKRLSKFPNKIGDENFCLTFEKYCEFFGRQHAS